MTEDVTFSAFAADRLIASGALADMLSTTKAFLDRNEGARVLIFGDQTGQQVDFNFQGTVSEVLARALPVPERVRPGRPRLGVVSREISLLPRHWEWLEVQPQGISATLRRLVDEAKKRSPGEQRARRGREAIGRFMTAMAGDLTHYEEATRSLFAKDNPRFAQLIQDWPKDVRAHLLRMLADFAAPEPERAP